MRAMAITVTPEVLAKIPLLSGLDRRALESFSRTLKQRTFRAGQIALDEGESGVGFFIVLDGTATVTIDGKTVNKLGPGDWFGELALLRTGGVRTATVTADTDLECVGLTAWQFRPFLEKHPEVAWQVMDTMAARLGDTAPA